MGKDLDILEGLFGPPGGAGTPRATNTASHELPEFALPADQFIPDLGSYDHILVCNSGGKDSMAAMLLLLELGISPQRIENHHHEVDGREGSRLMDWPVTHSYMEKVSEAFNVPVYFSWKVGGFEREMTRNNCGTAPITFTRGDGTLVTMGGERSKANTRMKFPQVSADLCVRWCSGFLKADVMSRLLINDERFTGSRTLVITGERAQESANRARYAVFEPDRADLRNGRTAPRHIDHWRPVKEWPEALVWSILRKYRLRAHPAYWAGFGRCSCFSCIFGSSNQWATVAAMSPAHFKRIADYENQFGVTIHRSRTVVEQASRGTCYPSAAQWASVALADTYEMPVFMDPWELPAGAFGESTGPV